MFIFGGNIQNPQNAATNTGSTLFGGGGGGGGGGLFGGSQRYPPTDELWQMTYPDCSWTKLTPTGATPGARFQHTAIVYKEKIYIYGGRGGDQQASSNQLHFFEPADCKWTLVSPKVVLPYLFGAAYCERSGKIFVLGGINHQNQTMNQFWSYNIEDDFFEVIQAPMTSRGGTLIPCSDGLILWGGQTGGGGLFSGPRPVTCSVQKFILNDDISKKEPALSSTNVQKGKQDAYSLLLRQMFTDKKYADVTFEIEGQLVPAHKNIIATRCKYFDQMFASEIMNSQNAVIAVTDINLPIFQALIEFIYLNEVSLTQDLALELVVLADKYSFAALKALCENYLIRNLSLDNYPTILRMGEKLDSKVLKDATAEYILSNLKEIDKHGRSEHLSNDYLWQMMLKLDDKYGEVKGRGKAQFGAGSPFRNRPTGSNY